MKKLKKEDIYISLQGKSKEELTYLYNFLESIGEDIFRNDIEWFLKYSTLDRDYAHLSYRPDYKNWGNLKTHNKQEVTIQQLKKTLQKFKASFKEPKSNELKALLEIYYSCRNKHTVINKDEIFKKYNCLNSEYMSVCLKNFNLINLKGRKSKWIASKPNENMADDFLKFVQEYIYLKNKKKYLERKNNNIIESPLTEQLEKAKAEVKRIEQEIEGSRIKVGDVCKFWDNNENSFVIGVVQYVYENAKLKYETIFDCQFPNAEKITDQELINKLNNLIK